MAFPKGHKFGNRFSSENQPKKRGGKQSYLKQLCKKLGIKESQIPDIDNDELKQVFKLLLFATPAQVQEYLKSYDPKTGKEKINPNADFLSLNLLACLQKNIARGNIEIIAWIIDRLFGKATQPIESDVNVVSSTQDLSNLSTEDLLKYKELLDKIEGNK